MKAIFLACGLMAGAAAVHAAEKHTHWEYEGKQGLPPQHAYYAFKGSLTTPPCSEDVRWQVLKIPVEVSKAQLAQFRKLYQMNARPVQPLNGRKVLLGGCAAVF